MKKIRLVTNLICFSLLVAFIASLIIFWKAIPDQVPTHFDALGNATDYGSKKSIIVFPILSFIMFGIFAVIESFPNAWNFPVKVTEENKERLINILLTMCCILKVLIIILMIVAGLSSVIPAFPVYPLYIIMGIMFLDIIIAIVRCVKNR